MMKNINILKCFALLVSVYINLSLVAQQSLFNGSQPDIEFIDSVRKYYNEEQNYVLDTADITILVTVYNYQVDQDIFNFSDFITLNNVFDELNQYFSPTHIKFNIFEIKTINDYNYANIVYTDTINEMVTLHSGYNTINLYIADLVYKGGSECFGYTYYPDEKGKNYIFINKNYLSGVNLTNLFGSFFGLIPTHSIVGGAELVNGTNCKDAGDFICDTPADPDLRGKVVNGQCYYRAVELDELEQFYVPTVTNFMSNSLEECKCLFTEKQLKRIRYYYMKFRNYLR